MYKSKQQLIFSPSDLTVFLDSPFASWMERARIEDPEFAINQDNDDPLMSLLASKGIEHENAFSNLSPEQLIGKHLISHYL